MKSGFLIRWHTGYWPVKDAGGDEQSNVASYVALHEM